MQTAFKIVFDVQRSNFADPDQTIAKASELHGFKFKWTFDGKLESHWVAVEDCSLDKLAQASMNFLGGRFQIFFRNI